MNKENIDKIFFEGLNTPMEFTNNEQQWAVVNTKLKTSNNRYFVWLWLLGISLVTVLTISILDNNEGKLGIQSSTTNTIYNQQNKIDNPTINDEKSNSSNSAESFKTNTSSNNDQIPKPIKTTKEKIDQSLITSSEKIEIKMETLTEGKSIIENNSAFTSVPEKLDKPTNSLESSLGFSKNTTSKRKDIKTNLHNIYTHTEHIQSLPRIIPQVKYSAEFSKIESKKILISDPIKKRKAAFSIKFGTMTDYLGLDIISDSRGYSPYLGFSFYLFDKLNFSTTYSTRNINRVIGKNHQIYNVPLTPNPYQTELSDSTNIQYANKSIDFNFDYLIWNNRFSKVSIGLGIQMNKNESHNLVYIYNGVYTTIIEELAANKQNWHFSDFTTGINIEIPISTRLRLDSRYQYHWSITNDNYKWSNRHRISLGIHYVINM